MMMKPHTSFAECHTEVNHPFFFFSRCPQVQCISVMVHAVWLHWLSVNLVYIRAGVKQGRHWSVPVLKLEHIRGGAWVHLLFGYTSLSYGGGGWINGEKMIQIIGFPFPRWPICTPYTLCTFRSVLVGVSSTQLPRLESKELCQWSPLTFHDTFLFSYYWYMLANLIFILLLWHSHWNWPKISDPTV